MARWAWVVPAWAWAAAAWAWVPWAWALAAAVPAINRSLAIGLAQGVATFSFRGTRLAASATPLAPRTRCGQVLAAEACRKHPSACQSPEIGIVLAAATCSSRETRCAESAAARGLRELGFQHDPSDHSSSRCLATGIVLAVATCSSRATRRAESAAAKSLPTLAEKAEVRRIPGASTRQLMPLIGRARDAGICSSSGTLVAGSAVRVGQKVRAQQLST